MARIETDPNALHKAMAQRIGELEAENIALELLLARAGTTIDSYEAGDLGKPPSP